MDAQSIRNPIIAAYIGCFIEFFAGNGLILGLFSRFLGICPDNPNACSDDDSSSRFLRTKRS